ncbi:chemotaxis protein CheW [uncultured Methylobacterium sp.]|uniref:chemotaxis protein CheW n=1 Tax=uncultured Methylobacterium sp. TaxID=157278 RepID=UPI0035CA5202
MNAADRETGLDADRAAREAARAAALRASRTEALARREKAGRAAVPTRAHLVCACGSERFGLPLAGVAHVLPMRPCTPVPGAVPAVLGLVALSGRIVGVIGLARALGRPGAGAAADGHLVVLRAAATPLALAVDRVLGVAHLAEQPEGTARGFGGEAVSRYAPAESGPTGLGDFVVIDLPRLLRRTLP